MRKLCWKSVIQKNLSNSNTTLTWHMTFHEILIGPWRDPKAMASYNPIPLQMPGGWPCRSQIDLHPLEALKNLNMEPENPNSFWSLKVPFLQLVEIAMFSSWVNSGHSIPHVASQIFLLGTLHFLKPGSMEHGQSSNLISSKKRGVSCCFTRKIELFHFGTFCTFILPCL